MKKAIITAACILLVIFTPQGRAQTAGRDPAEAYAFYARRNSTSGADVAGGGLDIFVYKGLGVGGDVGTTVGDPDNRMTIWSGGASDHFLCCRADRKIEPFAGFGYSYLVGDINTHGYSYPFDPGQDRSGPNFSQGLTTWPTRHVGVRFELRE